MNFLPRANFSLIGYDNDSLADDLAAVLDYAEADDSEANSAAFVGFSIGGGEVARFALFKAVITHVLLASRLLYNNFLASL